jgi:hypothetical protein
VETTSRTVSTEPAFHSNEVEEAPEYSSLSALAIAGLLFGLASPLCLITGMLLFLPLAGLVLSVSALVRIATSDGTLAGRWVAVVGLAMSIVFGVAQLSRGAITRYWRTSEAQAFANDWLRLVAGGDFEEAFRRTVDGQRPDSVQPPGVPPSKTTPLDDFKNSDVIKAIAAAGTDADIDFEGTQEYERQTWRHFIVTQRFQISPNGANRESPPATFHVLVTSQRSQFIRERNSRWLIRQYEFPTDAVP